jgi:putative membrane protein
VLLAHGAVDSSGLTQLVPALPLLIAGALYLFAYRRVSRQRVGWPFARLACFLGGVVAVAVALLPPLAAHDEAFPVHVVQHLLLAMTAPLLLALSAPVTLALRTLPRRRRRILTAVLHARPLRVLTHPIPAALLDFVPLYLLYLTPLYGYTLTHPVAHEVLHAHFLLAGCLFASATVGVDPLPGRASVRVRGAVIVLAFAAHATISKAVYAAGPGAAGAPDSSLHEWQLGAQIMWYGGDAVELLLVIAFALQWYRLEGKRYARSRQSRASASRDPVSSGSPPTPADVR